MRTPYTCYRNNPMTKSPLAVIERIGDLCAGDLTILDPRQGWPARATVTLADRWRPLDENAVPAACGGPGAPHTPPVCDPLPARIWGAGLHPYCVGDSEAAMVAAGL